MPKAMATKQKTQAANEDRYTDDLTEIEKMLDDFNRQIDEKSVANTPEWVKQEVREKMSDWKRQSGIRVAKESGERLAQKLIEVVDRVIRLALEKPEAFRLPTNVEQE